MQGVGLDNSSTHKFLCYNATSQVWNGSAFETWVDANVATYLITATRIGTTKGYKGTLPSALTARWELWYWTGSLSTSYAVFDSADMQAVNGEAVSFATNFPIVLPFTATSVNPGPTLNNIRNLYQYSAPSFQWTILDATGAAVSLSGKSIQLKVYTDDGTTRTVRYTYTTAGGTVTISGAGNNVVAVTFSATHTASVYPNLRYELQNTTDKLVLAAGSIDMVPAMDMT